MRSLRSRLCSAMAIAVACALLAFPQRLFAAPDPTLAAHYSFDAITAGVVRDESGNGNNLRAQGTVTLEPGKFGQAVSLSSAGYLQAPASPSLELGGEMTLEAWIYPTANPDSGMRILDRQTIGGNDGFMLDTYPEGHLRLILASGQLRADDPIPLNTWTHVAATYSDADGVMRLFMNGRVAAESYVSGKLRASSWPLNVGASQGGGDCFQRLIDEVRIYHRALEPEEIAAHFQGKEIPPPSNALSSLPLPIVTRNDTPRVDYAALCARNDLVYLQPALYPFEAMHLGNGNLGVTLWNQDGLTWQLNNGSYRLGNEAVSSGKISLSTPVLSQSGPTHFEQRTRLWDGIVTTEIQGAAGSASVTSFVAEPVEDGGEPRTEDGEQRTGGGERSTGDGEPRTGGGEGRSGGGGLGGARAGEIRSLPGTPHLSLGRPDADCLVVHYRGTGAGPQVLTLHLWRSRTAAHFHTGPDYIALSEHADHAEPFLATGMAVLVKVVGARVLAGQKDERSFTLILQGEAPEYTLYIANPLVRGSEEEALQAADAMILHLQADGYEKLLARRGSFWHSFWPRSFLHLTSPRGDADFMENLWYLFFYDLASMSRDTLAPKFNGGNWLVHEDERHWGGGYWHQNTREIFWPVYAANHVELSNPFFELYWRMVDGARERGKIGFNANGFYFYEVSPLNGGGPPHPPLTPSYSTHLVTVGLEVTLQAWWRYQFTGDAAFLRERVYPLLKGCLDFYLDYAKKGPDGYYHIQPANAQETYWAVKDPHQDLAALRWAIPVALRISRKLNVDADLRPRWQDLLDHLAPYPADPGRNVFLPADITAADERHNSENVEDYGVYPFGQFGVELPDYERALNTFRGRPVPGMGNGWEPAPIVAARLGLGDEAAKRVLAHMQANLRSNNGGWYSPTTDVFVSNIPDAPYFDSPGVSAQALDEMALQSQDGILRLFPVWPGAWNAQYRLLARGGFLVTAESHSGQPRYALIQSQWGGPCTLANPWPLPPASTSSPIHQSANEPTDLTPTNQSTDPPMNHYSTAIVTCSGKEILRSSDPVLRFATEKGKTYRVERVGDPVARMAYAPLKPAPAEGPKSLARHLPPYPDWPSVPFLGIDAEGHTPQRALMERNRRDFAARLAAATAGLTDLSTGKATASVTDGKQSFPAPALLDGAAGGEAIVIPNGGAVVIDLQQAHEIGALAFSRDPSGLFVDDPVIGYTVETSTNGVNWTLRIDHHSTRALPIGQVDTLTPATARYLRLRLWGQYNGASRLMRVTVYGSIGGRRESGALSGGETRPVSQ